MVATSAKAPGQGLSGRTVNPFPFSMAASALGTLALIVATVVMYWPSYVWMAQEWSSGSALFSHGYLISAIAIYLVIRSLHRMPADIEVKPQWWGLPIVLAISLIWLLGWVASVAVVYSTVVPFIVLAAVYAAFGPRIARHMAFSILFICFALPTWQYLQPPFRDLAIWLIDMTIQAIGIPIHVEGSVVHLPAGSFRIINGCSGINFIVVGLALSTLYGHLYYTKFKARLILIATAIFLAIVTNWIRVVSLALIGNATKMQSELIYDHLNYGWALFSIALIPLYLVARRLDHAHASDEAETGGHSQAGQNRRNITITLFVLVLTIIGPIWANVATSKYDSSATATITLPTSDDNWVGPLEDVTVWFPTFVGTSGEAIGQYNSRLGTVWLYRNVYLSQEQGRELIYLFNDVTGDLRARRAKRTAVMNGDGELFTVKSQVATRGRHQWLIWSWYTVEDRIVVNDYKAKVMQAIATLRGRPESGLTAVAVMCEGDCGSARSVLADFVKSGAPIKALDYVTGRQEN